MPLLGTLVKPKHANSEFANSRLNKIIYNKNQVLPEFVCFFHLRTAKFALNLKLRQVSKWLQPNLNEQGALE